MVLLCFGRGSASPPKRCLRSLLRFILPAIEQVRSDPVTPTRLRDVPTFDSFLYNLPLLFRGSIYAWFPAHVASCWEALILSNSGVQFSGEHYIAFFPTLCSTRIASAKRSLSVLFIPF